MRYQIIQPLKFRQNINILIDYKHFAKVDNLFFEYHSLPIIIYEYKLQLTLRILTKY